MTNPRTYENAPRNHAGEDTANLWLPFHDCQACDYLRLEAESLALLVLFLQDDALAQRWAEITKATAQQFLRDTQPMAKAVLKQFDLNNTCDIVSGSAQHVRMAGLVRSMMSNKPGQISLPDQRLLIPTRDQRAVRRLRSKVGWAG